MSQCTTTASMPRAGRMALAAVAVLLGVGVWLVICGSREPSTAGPSAGQSTTGQSASVRHPGDQPEPRPMGASTNGATDREPAARRTRTADAPPPPPLQPAAPDDAEGPPLRGEVLTAQGTPILGAAIVLTTPTGRFTARATSTRGGRFSIARPHPAELQREGIRLVLRKAGFVTRTVAVAPDRRFVSVRLDATRTVAGQVLDARTGRPVERFAIEAQRLDDPDADPEALAAVLDDPARRLRLRPTTAVETRPDGRFELSGLAPGKYALVVDGPRHLTTVVGPFELDAESVAPHPQQRVWLEPGAAFELVVYGVDGRGVSGAEILLEHDEADEPIQSISLDNGHVPLPALRPGHYTLEATAPGFAHHLDTGLLVSAAGGSHAVRLTAGATVHGIVRDTRPTPPRATRELEVRLRHSSGRIHIATVDLQTGAYEVRGLEPGTYDATICAAATPAHEAIPAGIARILANHGPATTRIRVRTGGRIRHDLAYRGLPLGSVAGEVTGAIPRGALLAQLRVADETNSPLGELPSGADTYLRAPVSNEGRFRIRWVPPGEYRLVVTAPSATDSTEAANPVAQARVLVRAGPNRVTLAPSPRGQ